MTVGEMLINHLSNGKTQKEISAIFKSEGVEPNSLSSIEKMLKSIRAKHGAKTMFHLGFIISNFNPNISDIEKLRQEIINDNLRHGI